MADVKTTNETTRAADGSELIRLATSGANWKTTLQSLLQNMSGSTQPNVLLGQAYYYNSLPALYNNDADGTQRSWFMGNAGNFTTNATSNFGMGELALSAVTTGYRNFGLGYNALKSLTEGISNTAVGASTGVFLTGVSTGCQANTFVGEEAGANGATNVGATFIGAFAGFNADRSVLGQFSTGIGYGACYVDKGGYNVCVGREAGLALNDVNSWGNILLGYQPCPTLTGNCCNIVMGCNTANSLTSGGFNTIIGSAGPGFVLTGNTVTTGSQNIILGSGCDVAGATVNGQLTIGNYIYGLGLTSVGSTVSTATIGIGVRAPASNLEVNGSLATKSPATKTGTSYSVTTTDSSLILNPSGTFTLTLQAASSYPGRWIQVTNIAAQVVISASSNVVPLASSTAGTAILTGTSGKWAHLQSDGTNWITLAAN